MGRNSRSCGPRLRLVGANRLNYQRVLTLDKERFQTADLVYHR